MINDSSTNDEWISAPTRLVGLRVSVQEHSQFYAGKVVRYTTATGQHTVLYDSGEEKVHDMHKKTFRIEGSTYLWTPERLRNAIGQKAKGTNLAASARSVKYPHHETQDHSFSHGASNYDSTRSYALASSYISRYPDAITAVSFHVCLDPKVLQPGDRVVLSGSLQCMGMWAAPVEMRQSDIDRTLWLCTLDVPLNMADSSMAGIMHYKYEIVSLNEGRISEGPTERTETKMKRNYFHTFRPNYSHTRFRGSTHILKEVAVEKFIAELLAQLRQRDMTFMWYMDSYRDLMDCIPNVQRGTVENAFDDFLGLPENENIRALDYSLCYLAMIGFFGVTSAEKYYQNQAGSTYGSSSYPFVGYQQTLVNRRPPKPTLWCHYVSDILSSDEFLHVDRWTGKFGRYNSSLIAVGVQEAVERLSEYSSYKWLKLTPILQHFDLRPRIVHPTAKAGREEFVNMTADLCELVRNYHTIGASLLIEQENIKADIIDVSGLESKVEIAADAIGLVALGLTPSAGTTELPRPYQLSIARDWLFGLILYAPALSSLSFLFTEIGMVDIIRDGIDVVEAFRNRIEEEHWNSEAVFDIIEGILRRIEQLRCPRIASAMLKNTSTTEKLNRVIDFIGLCVGDGGTAASDHVANSRSISHEESGVSGDWLELSTAAKDFFRRHHAMEPIVESEKKADNSWMTAWYATPKLQKKTISEQELFEIRRKHMGDAFDTVSRFLNISFFDKYPSGLFFELGRSWFLSGRPLTVMSCLVDLSHCCEVRHLTHAGVRSGIFLSYHATLSAHLSQYVVKTMKMAVDSNGALPTVEFLTTTLPAHGEGASYAHYLIYELIVYVTWEVIDGFSSYSDESIRDIPLKSVLENHNIWIETYLWCFKSSHAGVDKSESPLINVLNKLCAKLADVKQKIFEDVVELQELQYISQNKIAFLELNEQIGNASENLPLLAVVDKILERMTCFEASMEHAQAYVSFFCSCGVKIDSTEIWKLIESLRLRYSTIRANEFEKSLQAIIAMPHFAWLYELRGSDLFLHFWREAGKEVCVETVISNGVDLPPALRRHRFDSSRRVNVARGDPHDNVLSELINVFGIQNAAEGSSDQASQEGYDEDNDDPLPFIDGFDDATAADMMAAYFHRQDVQNAAAIKIDHVVLSQYQVTHLLLPKVKAKWSALGFSILSRSISIADLENVISAVTTFNINEELRLLSLNDFKGCSIVDTDKKVLISSAIRDMNKFSFLCKLRKWIPALLSLHQLLIGLCNTELVVDELRTRFVSMVGNIHSAWPQLTLSGVSSLITGISSVFEQYPTELMNFLSFLGNSPELAKWLLTQNSTEEFNRLLQVVRPCTDEPRLLSAIASLVHVRTLLLQPLYASPPYADLTAMLESFKCINVGPAESGFDSEALWHLSNVASSFDGLMDVFDRQTVSPGIKACYSLVELLNRGSFVLLASENPAMVLSVSISNMSKNTAADICFDESASIDISQCNRVENIEYLLDLRSKLMMTEIPPELDQQLNASILVDAFVQQFQLLCEMRDVLVKLHNSGHISFQEESYKRKFGFTLTGINELQGEYEFLVLELKEWGLKVKNACEQHYFLNFFTMREILHLRKLVLVYNDSSKIDAESVSEIALGSHSAKSIAADIPDPNSGLVCDIMAMGFSRDHAVAALRRCGDNLQAAIEFVLSNGQYMDRIAQEEAAKVSSGKSVAPADCMALMAPQLRPMDEIVGLMHLITSRLSSGSVSILVEQWIVDLESHANRDKSTFLMSLGSILGSIFNTTEELKAVAVGRSISLPSTTALHRADTLIHIVSKAENDGEVDSLLQTGAAEDEKQKRIPVFVACTEGPEFVLDATLSVYIRRGRMPEPGEVLFCTADTTMEVLTLLLMRFIFAKKHGRGASIFTVADLHKLSYASQCSFVEILRLFLRDYGQDCAGTLLLISGLPRQVAMNSLSSQVIDLPPLELFELRRSIKEALSLHSGETLCVASTVNGGGKSHYIQSQISWRQRTSNEGEILHRKVPIRESTDANRLLSLLSLLPRESSPGCESQFAFHLDIGHVIPEVSNTLLFELLFIGIVRDPTSSRCYFRNPRDIFYVEVPNSPNNKTAEALRICCLLPTVVLSVTADTLEFAKPIFVNPLGTRIATTEYSELTYVCKWLRALKSGKLHHGSNDYDADFNPYMDTEISAAECFAYLYECCISKDGPSTTPSWAVFHSFIIFMNMQFTNLHEYPLTQGGILACIQGLENFKEVFVKLLIETSKDFSLRSVPQFKCVGPPPGSLYAIASSEELAAAIDNNSYKASDALPPAPPSIRREKSAGYAQAEHNAALMNPPVSIRQSSEELVARFRNMVSWEQSEHPIVAFRMDERGGGGVSGVDIISLNRAYLSRHMDARLIQLLEANRFEFDRDWSSITNDEGVAILRAVDGLADHHHGGTGSIETGYVMTVDNMLKMLSIQLRLRYNLPVIVMGETGCGKSTLIRNMCAILGVALHTLNVHGGMEDQDIINWMASKISMAKDLINDSSSRIFLFLDEINTCNCMGLFKEIVCDRSMNGIPLLDNIKIIAACNPYRLRTTKNLYGGEEMAGLIFEHFSGFGGPGHKAENVGTGIKDPLRNLVYRVHPLPESMIDHIFDFGALSAETEKLYIHAMLSEQLGVYCAANGGDIKQSARNTDYASFGIPRTVDYFEEFIEVFTDLVCTAQECVRHIAEGERSVTSLRDVSRCVKIFLWFAHHFADTRGVIEGWNFQEFLTVRGTTIQKYVRKCVILSISYCYHARLPRTERNVLIAAITTAWRRLQASGYQGINGNYAQPRPGGYTYIRPKCPWLKLESNSFLAILEDTQREFVSVMNLGEGIALNEALCENLFMILCSILNKIPIFVIGKPGSSKSLAMGLIQSNLNGDASEGFFLKSLPAVEIFSYQCSPLSTSAGIEQVFESSRGYLRQASNTVVVVLLDEVGLAEQSPHLPLKVLHKLLDEMLDGEAMVGISNWSLDPAKMNRAVHLYRPAPTIEDLSLTAEGMVRSANLKGYLQSIAKAYDETYREQEHFDFWGLREFYSTVKAINSSLAQYRKQSGSEIVLLNGPTLLNAILRNFGGRPHEMPKVVNCFFAKLGLPLPPGWEDIPIEQLISDNLQEPEARHLMLLTKSNAALGLLLDRNIVKKDRTEIIFGSDFSLDKTDLYICLQLQRIKHCMAEGVTVILVHCEALYESLYDLLNQHYVEYGGQIYVRIAFGTYTKLCPIHRTFRVVVIVEKREAYTRLAPPLLNRFEKQVFERKDILKSWHWRILQGVQNFIALYCCKDFSKFNLAEKTHDVSKISLVSLRFTFCGFHADFLSSLILAAEYTVINNFEKSNLGHEASALSWKDIEQLNDGENYRRHMLERAVLAECIDRLLWLSPPEAVCRMHSTSDGEVHKHIFQEYAIDVMSTYFMRQRHSSLAAFASHVLFLSHPLEGTADESDTTNKREVKNSLTADQSWRDELGCQVVIVTHAPLDTKEAKGAIESSCLVKNCVTSIVLHELDQERELRQTVSDFFKNAHPGCTLLVQCDPLAASKRRIEHAKFIIELARAKRYKQTLHMMNEGDDDTSAKERCEHTDGCEEKVMVDGTEISHQAFPNNVETKKSDAKIVNEDIHVVMLIHLARGDDAGGEGRYCVDFDTRWKYAFVDSLTTAAGLPDISAMIGKSAVDIFDLLDAKKILLSAFRPSLARLNYFYDRTSEDVRSQIICVLRCLENTQFVDLIISILKALIPDYTGEKNDSGTGESWLATSIDALADKELQLAGTFQSALHNQILEITSALLAIIVSHMFRNETLKLYLNAGNTSGSSSNISAECALWLYLFQTSFNGASAISLLKQKKQNNQRIPGKLKYFASDSRVGKIIEVKGDGADGNLFVSRFPFSFYLVPVVDSMRKVCEQLDELHLIRQFSTTGLGMNLTERQDPCPMDRYMYDFMCMRCRPVSGMSRDEQASIFGHLLGIYGSPIINNVGNNGDESKDEMPAATEINQCDDSIPRLEYFAQIHWRYWRLERYLSLVFDLINLNPLVKTAAQEFIMSVKDLNNKSHFNLLLLMVQFLRPERQQWEYDLHNCMTAYSKWLKLIPQFKATLFSLLDLLQLEDNLEAIVVNEWSKIEFIGQFVKDCCIPLEISPMRLNSYSSRFDDNCQIVSPVGFKVVITLLSEIKRELASGHQVPEDLICPITQVQFINPVRASDGITYEMMAIADWMQKEMRSPMTNLALPDAVLTPDIKIKRRLEIIDTCDLNRILDFYVFNIIFAAGTIYSRRITPSLIIALLQLASGSYIMNMVAATRLQSDRIALSFAGTLSLFRELLKLSDLSQICYGFFSGSLGPLDDSSNYYNTMTEAIENSLRQELQESYLVSGNLDMMLSSVYISVRDSMLTVTQESYEALICDFNIRRENIKACLTAFCANNTSVPSTRLLLDCIVYMRSSIKLAAESLCSSKCPFSSEQASILHSMANNILSKDGYFGICLNDGLLRCARIYFLKCIERKRGVSFLRSTIMSSPLLKLPWVVEWRKSGDVGFSRFIGSNKLPKWNPFIFFPMFNEIKQIVASFVSTRNIDVFDSLMKDAIDNGNRDKVLAAFMLAGFHEVGMLQLLPSVEDSGLEAMIEVLRQWIRSSAALTTCSPVEKEMLEFCVVGLCNPRGVGKGKLFSQALNEHSSSEEVMMYRIVVHLVAVSFSTDSTHPFSFIKQVIFSPGSLSDSFFPTMPEDITKMAQEALQGRWYACPNGHPFYVDLCGRPTEVITCRDCGAEIGGQDHNLLSSNKDLGNIGTGYHLKTVLDDKSERKYCIGSVEQEKNENRIFTTRELGPTAVRIIRLLLHTALSFGSCLKTNKEQLIETNLILNRSYCNPSGDLPSFFDDHLLSDWELLTTMLTLSIDDVSVILHGILLKAMHVQNVPFFMKDKVASAVTANSAYQLLRTVEARAQWEHVVDSIFIGSMTQSDDMKQRVAEIFGHCCGHEDDSNGAFACTLLEIVSVETIPVSERMLSLPGLWLYTRHFSLDHLTMTLNMQVDATQKYPALTRFLADEPQLRALQYMPAVFDWFHLLKNKCYGHLDRETARIKTAREMMLELGDMERIKFDKAFSGFAAAWNESWSHVQKFGCIRFPSDFNNVVMNLDTPLSFCLPNEQDEGNCPLALAHYLVDKHNAFIQVADESRLLRDKKSNSSVVNEFQYSAGVISSRFFTAAHTIRYSLHEELVPWLEKTCVTWNVDGAGYDFNKAETLIADRVLSGLPAIRFELQGFQYMFEQHLLGGLTSLRAKLKQIVLTKDLIESIKREVSTPTAAHHLLGVLETVISFLTATGGSIMESLDQNLGNMLLSKYASSVLMISEEFSCRTISQQVQLKHLESLWKLLTDMTNCDTFAKVHIGYKANLSSRNASLLNEAINKPGFDTETLLSVMKAFITDQLQDKIIDTNISVAVCLGDCEVGDVYLSDSMWFADCFPKDLLMSEIVEAYFLLSRCCITDLNDR